MTYNNYDLCDYIHTLFNGMLSGITHDMRMKIRRCLSIHNKGWKELNREKDLTCNTRRCSVVLLHTVASHSIDNRISAGIHSCSGDGNG